jgi:hypothetical protein
MPEPLDVGMVEPANYVQASTPIPLQNQQPQMPMQMSIESPRATQESSQKVYSDKSQKEYAAAMEAQKAAVDAQMKFEQAKADEAAKLQAETQGAMQASYDRQAQDLQEKQSKYEAGVASYDQAVSKYASAKLADPRENESVFGRIGAAIAVGLGAYASAKTGTPNYALQIVNDTIDRSIANQKFMIEKLGVEAASKKSDLARLGQELGNFDLAEKALRQTMLEKTKSQIDLATAKSASEGIKIKGGALKAGIDEQIAKTNMEKDVIVKRNVETSGNVTSTSMGAGTHIKTDKEVTEFNSAYKAVTDAFDAGAAVAKQGFGASTRAKIPSALGGTSGELKVQQAGLSAAIVGKVPGIRSDADYDRVIVPMLPQPFDPERTIASKKKALETFFASYAPASWLKQRGKQSPQESLKNNLGFQGN